MRLVILVNKNLLTRWIHLKAAFALGVGSVKAAFSNGAERLAAFALGLIHIAASPLRVAHILVVALERLEQ